MEGIVEWRLIENRNSNAQKEEKGRKSMQYVCLPEVSCTLPLRGCSLHSECEVRPSVPLSPSLPLEMKVLSQ